MGVLKTRVRCSAIIIATLLVLMSMASSSYATAPSIEWTGLFSKNWSNWINWTTTFSPLPGDYLVFSSTYTKYIPDSEFVESVPVHSYSSNNNYLSTLQVDGMFVVNNYYITGNKIEFSPTGSGLSAYFPVSPCEGVTRDTIINLDIGLLAQTNFNVSGGCGYYAALGGEITGPYGFNKIGNGRLRLDGENKLFTGNINLNGGTLSVDVTTFSEEVVVNGGNLRGSGTVNKITVKNSGALYPGVGDLTCIGNVTFESGSTYRVDIARPGSSTDADKLIVGAGSVTLGDGVTALDPKFLMTPTPGQTYTLVEGASAVTGYFTGLPEGVTGSTGEIYYQITYQGGSSGKDVVLTVLSSPVATETVIYPSLSSYNYGEDPLVLLEVSSQSGSERPCGSAEYRLDGLSIATCSLSLGGETMSKCQIDLINPQAGTHTLTTSYPGCSGFGPSYQEAVSAFVVNKDSTSTNLSSSAESISVGDTVTFTFEALEAPGEADIPTGAVLFKDNDTELSDCRQGLDETGSASCTTSLAEAGLRTISVEYGGDINYTAVTRNLQGGLIVNGPPLITSTDSIIFIAGTTGNFTVTTTGYPIPSLAVSGTLPAGVTFQDNGDGTATLSGAPATVGAKGNYPVTISATNGISPDADQNFTLRVEKPEIRITGNNLLIQDGDTTPRPEDNTDFSNTLINGGSQTKTYAIDNIGNMDLLLTGSPAVTIAGANSEDFTVTMQPASSSIASAHTKTFSVTFDPFDTGLRSATVSIGNNDADENPYSFAIQGTGYALPDVTSVAITAIGKTMATCQGEVKILGFPVLIQHGCVWNTSGMPTIGDWKKEEGTLISTGPFASSLEGLSPGEIYFVRAYATNPAGTVYGEEIFFTAKKQTTWGIFMPAILGAGGDQK